MNALSLKADKLSFCSKIEIKCCYSVLIASFAQAMAKRINLQRV